MYGDFNDIFYDISKAAKQFQSELSRYAQGRGFGDQGVYDGSNDYDWPPVNIYTTCNTSAPDGSLVFEFGLAGFDEEDINLTFQGDYMILSAVCRSSLKACDEQNSDTTETQYLKKNLRLDNIEKQKYYTPLDKYAQEKTSAVYKNGLLRVSIPPKEENEQPGGIKIKISS
ncbi:MAG: Hsp20/alpha crystallin family protein [Spirochaetaceae bacterium]|jgi:HSP20 family molecular chaperone IbpA|nr:Hsp20/alpha crystallin family protein [Spirochaetaceae bacterium]